MLVVNMYSVKSGGGLQNALSFLKSLKGSYAKPVIVVCIKGGDIYDYCVNNDLDVRAVSSGFSGFIYFHFLLGFFLRFVYRAVCIFSIFGPPPYFSYGVRSVSGFAYSNIIQREVDFWGFLPFKSRLIKLAIDFFRLHFCLRADELIVETDYLRKKSLSGVFKNKTVHVVEMQPSALLEKSANSSFLLEGVKGQRILYLSGPHPNKRIHKLAGLIKELNSLGDYRLVITLPFVSDYFQLVKKEFEQKGVLNKLVNVGPVFQSDISSLINDCHAMINVSVLESFSNNWVEAWFFQKPLLVTDSEWARASCLKAAIYIDPEAPDEASFCVHEVFSDDAKMSRLIEMGEVRLQEMRSSGDKFSKYLSIIEK